MKLKTLVIAAAVAGLGASASAWATNGYFQHGYGVKAKGRAGAGTAMTTDAFGGANNPAQMVWVGRRMEVGIDWFRPIREASRVGSAGGTGAFDFNEESENEDFFIPEFAYNMMLSPDMSLGVTVYGNGGMNTTWEALSLRNGGCAGLGGPNPANPLCGIGALGVNLSQLIIAPTLGYKVNAQHSLGVSPLIGYQRFKSFGLQGFGVISSFPASVTTNPGTDDAWGFGVRIGWLGKLTDSVSVGAAYSSKIYMEEFDKYKGLFAEQGDFDVPSNFNIGIAFKAMPAMTIALDWQRIWYSDVDSVANRSSVGAPGCVPNVTCLGGSAGFGFGWQDVDVIKLGIEYQYSEKLTLRAGYSHGDNPIEAQDVTFNILAPGVIEDHVSLGFTYALSKTDEISMHYTHAFENDVSGPAANPNFPVGGTETIRMHQDALGIQWARKW